MVINSPRPPRSSCLVSDCIQTKPTQWIAPRFSSAVLNKTAKSHMRAVYRSWLQITCVFAGRERRGCFLPVHGTLFKNGPAGFASPANCGSLLGRISSQDNRAKRHLWKHFKCSSVGYRGWFSPTMRNAWCTWVGLRLDRVHEVGPLCSHSPKWVGLVVRVQLGWHEWCQ